MSPRRPQEAAAMAVAVQANLVTLKVAWARRSGGQAAEHDIRTPSPGAVTRFREALVDRHVIQAYSELELVLRTRQVWGQFALFCWAFGGEDPHRPPDFARLPEIPEYRCPMAMIRKEEEIVRGLWRLKLEQRARLEPDSANDGEFVNELTQAAASVPMRVYGNDVRESPAADLIQCACEHAGMLAAVRWLLDDRRVWDEPGLMDVGQVGDAERA
ncbi:MAG: hypothetical protein L6R00_00815 [Phycisphaerae bacterium]|nr:hypothetical protein [Phycisphaerae bacterium]